MDNDEPTFDLDKYMDNQARTVIAEFGWPDESDESYSGEEGDGD